MGYLLPIQRANPLATQPNMKKRNLKKVKGPLPVVFKTKYEERDPWKRKNRFNRYDYIRRQNQIAKNIKKEKGEKLQMPSEIMCKGRFIHETI